MIDDRPSSYNAIDYNSIVPPLNTTNSGFFAIESVENKNEINSIVLDATNSR